MNTFTTKFKVGDTVWVCYEQTIYEANIKEVIIRENSIGYNCLPKGFRQFIYRAESVVHASQAKAQKAINCEKIDRLLEQIKKHQKVVNVSQGYIASLQSEIEKLKS